MFTEIIEVFRDSPSSIINIKAKSDRNLFVSILLLWVALKKKKREKRSYALL